MSKVGSMSAVSPRPVSAAMIVSACSRASSAERRVVAAARGGEALDAAPVAPEDALRDRRIGEAETGELQVDAGDRRGPCHERDERVDELLERVAVDRARAGACPGMRVDGVEGLADDLEDRCLLRVEQVVEAADPDVGGR
jgi:hypothetical protein